ncbi:NUDIX domain-containing protein [Nocardiopsis xinjiangensis]|uniref:NUDIX domain-containing protein n=1 Tax=Nocardiopsis xinjiangensis TaxID=124285 RepID=UPI00034992CD|nr:NUDIX domain-containing protein [Nocardiopsis xinjiangensis]
MRMSVHVLLLWEDRVLLTLRGPSAAFAPGLWHAGVAGKAEPGEELVAAALRESGEELGVTPASDDLSLRHVVHQRSAVGEWEHAFFVSHRWSGVPYNREPHKHAQIRWWAFGALPGNLVPYCATALARMRSGESFTRLGDTAD